MPATIASAADPITTDVVIHKMKVDAGTATELHNGQEITNFTGTNLEGATPLGGIIFKYWRVASTATPANMAAIAGIRTVAEAEAYAAANPSILTGATTLGPTNASGIVTVAGMAEGIYLFVETNGPALNVTEYIGVPFLLELPAMKTDGTSYFGTGANALHVYPKNAIVTPGLDVETRSGIEPAGTRIGASAFAVDKKNAGGAFERVTGIGTGGIIPLATGFTSLADLPSGEYSLTLTSAPPGYLVDSRPIYFTVSAGVVTFNTTDSNPMSYFVPPAGTTNAKIVLVLRLAPVPDKDIEGLKARTYEIGDTIPYTVTLPVPADIALYDTYFIKDTLDSKLSFGGTDLQGDVVVKAGTTVLVAGTHYTKTVVGQVLTVNFIPAALDPFAGGTITVDYKTFINSTAVMGEDIYNDVELTFDNGRDGDGTTEPPDPPVVWTGGARFVKVDAASPSTFLAGAEFKIARNAAGTDFVKWTAALIAANTATTFGAKTVGADIVMISNTSGYFEIKGLAGGTYYLVETKAPVVSGVTYNLLRDPAAFTVTRTSYTVGNEFTIQNRAGLQIPQTGGIGTALFTAVGLSLMGFAIFLFRKKRRNSEAS